MEKYFARELTAKVIKYLPMRQIIAILGPRQAGKTTLFQMISRFLQQEKGVPQDHIFYFTFEDVETRDQFNLSPKEFIKRRIEGCAKRSYFFLDEYHWVKQGGQTLKMLFDVFSPKVKFFITGSSSLELTFQTGKFLVGRVFYFHLYPFSFAEFINTKEKEIILAYQEERQMLHEFRVPKQPTVFDQKIKNYFEEFALFGGYPEVVKTKDRETKKLILKSIINTYLEKDIRSLLLIEDLEGYRKLLQILSSQIGTLLSYQQLSSDTSINVKVVKKYLAILEETYVLERIRPFYKNVTSELRKNPKLYFFDTGLRDSLLEVFTPLASRVDKGQLAENFVFSQTQKQEGRINFWRTKGGAEVDFILKKEGALIPIEVKFQKLVRATMTKSFQSFLSCYRPAYGIILTDGFWGEVEFGSTKVIFSPLWCW